jgi:hypothetical protein
VGERRFRDFGKTKTVHEYEPLDFALNGQEFHCVSAIPGAVLLDFVRRADSDSGGASASAITDFFRQVLAEEDRDRFTELVTDPEQIVELEILGEIAGWLVEQYSERPTREPSRSSKKRGSGGRTSTAGSSDEE